MPINRTPFLNFLAANPPSASPRTPHPPPLLVPLPANALALARSQMTPPPPPVPHPPPLLTAVPPQNLLMARSQMAATPGPAAFPNEPYRAPGPYVPSWFGIDPTTVAIANGPSNPPPFPRPAPPPPPPPWYARPSVRDAVIAYLKRWALADPGRPPTKGDAIAGRATGTPPLVRQTPRRE